MEEKESLKQETSQASEKKVKKKKNDKEEEIIKLKEDLAKEIEKSMRIQAEMMNFKRRKEEEVATFRKYANEDVLKSLIGVTDNFERALSLENEENKEFMQGFKMIYNNINNILKDQGVAEIDCLNKPFDPNYHQAVFTEKKEGVEAGLVIEVLQKGYTYKDRVLRASMVKVSE